MTFRLPRLPRGIAIIGPEGAPLQKFQLWWQSVVDEIEGQESLQDATIVALQTAQLDIIAVQADIVAANADIIAAQADITAQLALINTAQATANTVTTANAISASWITPAAPLSATDAGANATITIANFVRYYDGDQTNVSVTGGSITALAYSTAYSIYYDDSTRLATAPTFVATTFGGQSRHNFAAGRHFVGTITTPASGAGGTSGNDYSPPGGGGVEVP